jgi:NrS-1  polymerase HBD domain
MVTAKDRKAALLTAPTPPPTLPVDPDGIPTEMKNRPRWVLWKWELSKSGKWTKPPIRVSNGWNASSTKPRTWSPFEAALAAYRAGKHGAAGIGYIFDASETGIDLDMATGDDGQLLPWAAKIVAKLDTYGERSPTDTGAKLLCRGHKPPGTRCKTGYSGGEVEVYDGGGGRYFTVTGQRLPGSPATVEERQDALETVCGWVWPRQAAAQPPAPPATEPPQHKSNGHAGNGSGPLTDEEVLRRCRENRSTGEKFRRLWSGDTSGHNQDDSSADLALCNYLRFYSGDRNQVDRLFRQSGLMRPKWDEKRGTSTYGQMTLNVAMDGKVCDPHTSRRDGARTETVQPGKSDESQPEPQPAYAMILDYFRQRYRPDFRRGNAIHCKDGREVAQQEACSGCTSAMTLSLAKASDAPRFKGGGVNLNGLPGLFSLWARAAWFDLLDCLPDEDEADLGVDDEAPEEFRRLVREAMLTEVTLGGTIGNGIVQTERRTLIEWCRKFAKPGPWKSIRSKQCWCKEVPTEVEGEFVLTVAIRHELFAQLKADRRLSTMGAKKFTRRAARYGVGRSTEYDRPQGKRAIVLDHDFLGDLTAGLPDENENDSLKE